MWDEWHKEAGYGELEKVSEEYREETGHEQFVCYFWFVKLENQIKLVAAIASLKALVPKDVIEVVYYTDVIQIKSASK